MAVVKLENVSKAWGDFKAVDDFNLTIEDEEFLVLLGQSNGIIENAQERVA